MIRKFFEPDVAEPAAPVQESLSIVQLMARQGNLNSSGGQSDLAPVNIQEKKEEPPAAPEASPVVTTTDTSPTATANPESQTPIPEPAKVQQPPIVAEPPKEKDWQEVLKSQQPDTVLKALGLDDKVVNLAKELQDNPKILNLFTHWKEKGDVVAYMKELSTDYTKMPAEEVMRHQLRKDYPTASEPALNALYKSKVVNFFKLNSEEEGEADEGRLLLEAEADRYRSELTKNQQNFLLPPSPEPKQPEPDRSEQIRQERDQLYRSRMSDNPYTKDVIANKRITIGEGDEKFNLPVEPNDLLELLHDPQKWANALFEVQNKADGTIDLIPKTDKQLRAAAFILYESEFLKEYAKHLKSLGGEKVIESLQNAKPPEGSTASKADQRFNSPAEAMAKQGQINSGGYR